MTLTSVAVALGDNDAVGRATDQRKGRRQTGASGGLIFVVGITKKARLLPLGLCLLWAVAKLVWSNRQHRFLTLPASSASSSSSIPSSIAKARSVELWNASNPEPSTVSGPALVATHPPPHGTGLDPPPPSWSRGVAQPSSTETPDPGGASPHCTSPERTVPWPLRDTGGVRSRTSALTCGSVVEDDDTVNESAVRRYWHETTLPRLAEVESECPDLVVYGVAFGSPSYTQAIVQSLEDDTKAVDSDTRLENHGRCFFLFVLDDDMPTTTTTTSTTSHTIDDDDDNTMMWRKISIPRHVLPYQNLQRNANLFQYHGHLLFPYAERIVWQDADTFLPSHQYARRRPVDYHRALNTDGACVTAVSVPVHPDAFGPTKAVDPVAGSTTHQPLYLHHCETMRRRTALEQNQTDGTEDSIVMRQCRAYVEHRKEWDTEHATDTSRLTLEQGLIDSRFVVWNYATAECRTFNAELQCTLSDQLQCHSSLDQVSFPFALTTMGLRIKTERTRTDRIDQRVNHLEFISEKGETQDGDKKVMVRILKSACHWYFRQLGTCADADRPSLAIVVAGSTNRFQFESTLQHLIQPMAKTWQYSTDFYATLVESNAPAFRQDSEYMNHLVEEPLFRPEQSQHFLDGTAVARVMFEKVEAMGGNLRGIDVRRDQLPIASSDLKRKRAAALEQHPDEDADLRFPMYDLRERHLERVANGNRNIINLFHGLQHLWDTSLVPFESYVGKQYDYVMILRDDALWLHDFDMNALLSVPSTTNSTADAYVLSCDARDPPMAPQETNDHVIVLKRSKAAVVGRYFSSLLTADLESCHKQAGFLPEIDRGCNSEMILTWILQENNITLQKVPQSLLPFERSVSVRKSDGSEERCFHKFCQSQEAPIVIPDGMRMCAAIDFAESHADDAVLGNTVKQHAAAAEEALNVADSR